MCRNFIGFGSCSKSYIYILFSIILKIINDNFFYLTSFSTQDETNFAGINPALSKHIVVQNLYKYISFIIGGIIFSFIIKKNTRNQTKEDYQSENSLIPQPNLIQMKDNNFYKRPKIEIIIVSFFYVLNYELTDILLTFKLINFYFWVLDGVFIIFFLKKYFTFKFYNYQKCSLIFMIISVFILTLISSFLAVDVGDSELVNSYNIIKQLTGSTLYLILFLPIINVIPIFNGYAKVKAKVLFDYKYISQYTIIIFIGIIGVILAVIELIIAGSFRCSENNKKFCMTESIGDNNRYYDNIMIYFNNLSNKKEENLKEFYLEIFLLMPIFICINFFELVCEFLVIIKLNPLFVLIQNNCYYFINNLLYGFFNKDQVFKNAETIIQLIIAEIPELIAIICYLIYLQIIELRFCGLDLYLKRNLIKLAQEESREGNTEMIIQEEDIDNQSDGGFGEINDRDTIIYK